jgi:predicted NUDIX family NTP pyrophosphohydrolase
MRSPGSDPAVANQISAGILLYRLCKGALEVFLVHPGGPYWRNKDVGAWSIPKGLLEEGDDELAAAKREFEEETGSPVDGEFIELTPLKQPSGKVVHAWAVEGDIDASSVRSNTFPMEWPPRSGKMQAFPEVDRGGWFTLDLAREKMLNGQRGFLDQLEKRVSAPARKRGP